MDVTGSRRAYDDPWLAVRVDTVVDERGAETRWTVVSGADIAMVVALDGDRLVLVEQYRHPVGGRRWELPSGSCDVRDADPATTARRELREETGLRADQLTALGTVEVLPSTLTHRCHVFLALGLHAGRPLLDAGEQDLRSAWFSRDQVHRMIAAGEITDARTLAAYALLLTSDRSPMS